MDSSEYYTYEDRAYIQPTLSSGEQEAFISNLRDIQSQNNQQIAQQTYNLGTRVPSNLGGLGGGEAYFNARYQTPQVNEMVSGLKAAADAQALNDVMSNYQAQLKQKYNNAYRNAQRRARAGASYGRGLGSNSSNISSGNTSGWDGDVITVPTNSGETGTPWESITIGDNAASYGINYLKRNEGETDDIWYKRANEWAEKLAGARNFLRTGKF